MVTELGRLERVDLRVAWKDEAKDFTPWLAREENLKLLGDSLGMDLELAAQEAYVGSFRADIVCKDTDGGAVVLIENQLERTDHTHLGQLLTYAAGLHAVTICWIAERFTDEHRASLDWLNEITEAKFKFFGLEVELWRIGDSLPAPKFNLVSKPNDWSRSIRKRGGTEPPVITPPKRVYEAFWTALMKLLEEKTSSVRHKTPRPQQWMDFSVGRTGFCLRATLHSTGKWISVDLFMTGQNAPAHFQLLQEQRDEIERELGELEWRELPNRKSSSIRLQRTNADPMQQEDWPSQLAWMVSTLEAFSETFRPCVKSLDASDWQPGDDSADA